MKKCKIFGMNNTPKIIRKMTAVKKMEYLNENFTKENMGLGFSRQMFIENIIPTI